MARKKKGAGALAGVAGEALSQVTPDALVAVLVPTLDEVAKRVHGVLDHAEDAAKGVVADAETRASRAASDAERRVRRTTAYAGDELRDVARDVNVKMAERVRDAKTGAESVLDSFMDRLLALALAIAIAYGAYFIAKSREGHVDLTRVAVLVWMGMTFFSVVIGVAWRLTDRPERLKHTLIWFLYIVALGGLGTLVLLVISKLPAF